MQPYQEASEEIRRQGEFPIKAARAVGTIAATAGSAFAGGAALSRVLPLLNRYVPEDLAIKGLSKIDPRFGKFISTAMGTGKSFDEIKDFIKEKAEGSEESQKQNAKDNRNIIQQYSPELHQFIDQEIKKGRNALEAGALARLQDKFKKQIKKIEEDHKTPWSAILETIYGGVTQTNNQPQTQMQHLLQEERNIPQVQQQPGQGQQALMAILQKLQQTRGMQ